MLKLNLFCKFRSTSSSPSIKASTKHFRLAQDSSTDFCCRSLQDADSPKKQNLQNVFFYTHSNFFFGIYRVFIFHQGRIKVAAFQKVNWFRMFHVEIVVLASSQKLLKSYNILVTQTPTSPLQQSSFFWQGLNYNLSARAKPFSIALT